MTAPTTGFEDTGAWTTLDQETAFLAQVDAQTSATVTEAGRSIRDRPIHRIDLGTGTRHTMLIVALQHGNEPASREAVLQLVRDMAYSTDPQVTHYLSRHRLVVVPNVNPDGFVADVRTNANNANLNRDWFAFREPESQAVAAVIAATRPHLILDAHEYFTVGPKWLGRANGLPSTFTGLQALSSALFEHVVADLQGRGHDAGPYSINSLPAASLGCAAGAMHAVGLLSETNATYDTPPVRVQVQRQVLDAAIGWHAAHAAEIQEQRDASRDWQATTTDPVPVVVEEFVGRAEPLPLDLTGYTLMESLSPLHKDVFRVVQSGTFAPMPQVGREALPMLADEASPHRVVNAFPGRARMVDPDRPVTRWTVWADGGERRVVRAEFFDGEQMRAVQVPGT